MKTAIIIPLMLLGYSVAKVSAQQLPVYGRASNDSLKLVRMVKTINRQEQINPIEKIYVQTDRSAYQRGDTLWYKVYLTTGAEHRPSTLSKVLYFELTGSGDEAEERAILPVQDGITCGQLVLPKHLKEGVYHLRAYTNWMRNAGPAYFFNAQITIGVEKNKSFKKTGYQEPDVQFFPEGGSLIAGIRTKMAFKAIGTDGYGTEIKGIIADNDGHAVASFKTEHLGMGVFAFVPQLGKTYVARVITADGHSFDTGLPKVAQTGFNLAINHTSADSLTVQINASAASFKTMQHASFYLVAQAAGHVYYASAFNLENANNLTRVSTKKFPTGIIQFTLFSSQYEPLNERLVFVQHKDLLNIVLSNVKSAYSPREKVSVQMKLTDDTTANGSFSVSVTADGLAGDQQDNILTDLLLKSDLKGFIEQPGYYFSDQPDAPAGLDLLMLTQGYRKVEWKQVFAMTRPAAGFTVEHSLSVYGILKDAESNLINNGKVELRSSTTGLVNTTTDKDGNFKFSNLALFENSSISVYGQTADGETNTFVLMGQSKYPPIMHFRDRTPNIVTQDTFTEAKSDSVDQVFEKMRKPDMFTDVNTLNTVTVSSKSTTDDVENVCHCSMLVYVTAPVGKLENFDVQGYALSREFYSPRYDVDRSIKKDQRSTLYWNPRLLTGADGMASFDFFNSDLKGNYRITVEGLDGDGHLGRAVLHYAVR